MGNRSGYDADRELDELANVTNIGSGFISAAQRRLNAQQNLGLIALVGGASGGAQLSQVDAESFDVLAAAFGLQNQTAAQPVFNSTTNGAFTVAGGAFYAFEELLLLTNTGTTSHTWSMVWGGTATFTTFAAQAYGNSSGTANAAATGGLSGFTTAPGTAITLTPASTSATEQALMYMEGVFKVNAGGTIIPQVGLSAQPGGTQTAVKGSFIRFWPLVGFGALGNWS